LDLIIDINKFLSICKLKNIRKAILFGSRANGKAHSKSDYDLIIIYETDKSFFQRYDDFEELYPIFENYLDLLPYTPKEWEKIKHRKFISRIIAEGKILYEKKS